MYCGKEWFTNMSKWMYEDVCKDCANKYIKVKERKTMKTSAYDLTLKIISIMGDIDSLLDEKSKTYDISDRERLDKEIDRKEAELFDLKNILKKGIIDASNPIILSNNLKAISISPSSMQQNLTRLLFFSKKAIINKTRAPKLTKKKLNLLNNPRIRKTIITTIDASILKYDELCLLKSIKSSNKIFFRFMNLPPALM